MLTDATGGGGYFLQVKSEQQRGKKGQRLVLRDGANHTFPYHVFEQAVLRLLKEIDPSEVLPKKCTGPSKIDVLKIKLEHVRADLAALKASLAESYSKAIDAALRAKEAEEEAVGTRLQEEKAKALVPTERAWKQLPTLADLVAKEGDPARLRLRPVLRRIIEDARVLIVRRGSYLLCAVQFHLAEGGGYRTWLIVNQAAGCNRPGGWQARSFKAADGNVALDLRERDQATLLAKKLDSIDLTALAGDEAQEGKPRRRGRSR
jgi:hypothetical protein